MRWTARSLLAALAAAALAIGFAPGARARSEPVYHVALGDSLATGAQSAGSGVFAGLRAANGTNRGYADVLHDLTRDELGNLQLRAALATESATAAPDSDLCVGSKPGCLSTIQAAVDAAQDGDTILIGAGHVRGRDHDREERAARRRRPWRDEDRGRRSRDHGRRARRDRPADRLDQSRDHHGWVQRLDAPAVCRPGRWRVDPVRSRQRDRGDGDDLGQRHHREPGRPAGDGSVSAGFPARSRSAAGSLTPGR